MAPARALILDFGNVLTWSQATDVVAAMAGRLKVPLHAFEEAYWQFRAGYDAGDYAGPEYWRRVLHALERPREASGPPVLHEWLIARDADSWTRYRDEMWALARDVRAQGVRTAMLSNAPAELAHRLRTDRSLNTWFDAVIFSFEARCVKPNPRIYRLCLDRLGVEAADAVFVDDRADNVDGAARLGLRTVHFAGGMPVADVRNAL